MEELTLDIEWDDLELEEEDRTLPMTPISMTPTPVGIDYRGELELARDAGRLFDFKGTKLSPLQQMYIIGYASKGTKKGACELSGVTISTVNKWMEDEEFTEALQNAVDLVRDSLEEELLTRAMHGSDKLRLEAVKAVKPDKYNKKMSDISVSGTMVHTWADLAKQAADSGKLIEVVDVEVDD